MGKKSIRQRFGEVKSSTCLLVLFVPSTDRDEKPIDQNIWVHSALQVLGEIFGGATAYPKARGVWRDDRRGGRLIFDEPVIVQCYTNKKTLLAKSAQLREFLHQMGLKTNQGAVGFVIDSDYFEIEFP